jgi:hypothetical protein
VVEAQCITDQQVMGLNPIDLLDLLIVSPSLEQSHVGQQGQHHRCRWCRCHTFVPWALVVMEAEGAADLSLENTGDESAPHREQRSRRDPCGLLQPYGADRRRLLAPAQAVFHRGVVLLLGLEHLGIRTRLRAHGRGQHRPPMVLLSVAQGCNLACQARARLGRRRGHRGRTAPTRATRATRVGKKAIP